MRVGTEQQANLPEEPLAVEVERGTKAESGGRTTSQHHKGGTSTKKRLGETQRLREEVWLHANVSKLDRWWIPKLISWKRGQYSNLNCPTLLAEELTKQSYT
jgi:hypothetical protein